MKDRVVVKANAYSLNYILDKLGRRSDFKSVWCVEFTANIKTIYCIVEKTPTSDHGGLCDGFCSDSWQQGLWQSPNLPKLLNHPFKYSSVCHYKKQLFHTELQESSLSHGEVSLKQRSPPETPYLPKLMLCLSFHLFGTNINAVKLLICISKCLGMDFIK